MLMSLAQPSRHFEWRGADSVEEILRRDLDKEIFFIETAQRS